MAVMAERDAKGKLTFMRLALGSMTPTPRRMREVEDFLMGKRPDEALLREPGRILATKIVEISGQRASTAYKEKAVQGLLMRMLYGIM